jgi:hypothetical protein
MGKTSYRGQGPRSRGQAITRGRGGARQTGGPQHQANPVHRLNTGTTAMTFVRATTTVVRMATKVARSSTRPAHPFMNVSDLSNIKDPSTNATTNQCHHKAWSRISNPSRRHPLRRPPMGPLPPPIQTMKLQFLTLDPTLLLKPTLDPDPEDNPVLDWSAICSRRILMPPMFKCRHIGNTSTGISQEDHRRVHRHQHWIQLTQSDTDTEIRVSPKLDRNLDNTLVVDSTETDSSCPENESPTKTDSTEITICTASRSWLKSRPNVRILMSEAEPVVSVRGLFGESKDFNTERAKTLTWREQILQHGERKVECQCRICLNADSLAKCRHQTLNILVTLAHQCWEHHVFDQYHPEL